VRIDVEVPARARPASPRDEGQHNDVPISFVDFSAPTSDCRATTRRPRRVRGTGSGVIIDSEGHVVTNAHVVARAQKVTDHARRRAQVRRQGAGRGPL
jgi:S1-C subfamily serine protease